jgi:hypothetical protein
MWWQAELLHHSYVKAGMRAQLTALVSRTEQAPLPFSCQVVQVSNYARVMAGAVYSPLNKPGAIAEWARRSPLEDTVLIIDPDSIFVRRVKDPGPLPRGEAIADEHDYMNPDLPASRVVLDRHCKLALRHKVQPVGIYILVNKSDLVELAARWLAKAVEIKSDPVCRAALPDEGWISEMWGYTIAAAELGIYHHRSNFSQVTGSNSLSSPIIHYCFPVVMDQHHPDTRSQTPASWHKGSYHPWERPPRQAATVEGQALLSCLDELAVERTCSSSR